MIVPSFTIPPSYGIVGACPMSTGLQATESRPGSTKRGTVGHCGASPTITTCRSRRAKGEAVPGPHMTAESALAGREP